MSVTRHTALVILNYHTIETARRYPKGQVKLVLLRGFSECGFRKALRFRVQEYYFIQMPKTEFQ